MEFTSIIIGTVGIIAILLIPGFLVSFAVFPKRFSQERQQGLDFIERLAVSFMFGLIYVYVLYFLDKNLSIKVGSFGVNIAAIAFVCAASILIWYLRARDDPDAINPANPFKHKD